MTRRALLRALLVVVAGLAALISPASPASAHAALLGSTPVPGSVIGSSPAEVVITFSEAVTPVPDRVTVLAPDGERISGTPAVRGSELRIPVRKADHPLGTYLVSYRVISADTHPVGGGLTFSVGAPSATPAAVTRDAVRPSVAVAVPIARGLGYAGLVLSAGPALFLGLLWPRRRSRAGATRLVHAGLGLTGFATLCALWLQAPNASGAQAWNVSATELGQVLSGPYGLTLTARLALLGIVAGLIGPVLRGTAGPVRVVSVLVPAVAGLTTWPLTGHAVASPLAPAIVAADVVHLAAMAVWLGGLATLSIFLLRGTPPRVLGVILPAWSRWAAIAVVWLVGAGAVQAVVQVGSVGALWRTSYGKLVLAKIAVLVVTLSAAWFARRLVQRAQVPAAGPRRLRRTVGVEVAATTVILAVSAVLVQVNPGRSAPVDRAAVTDEGVSGTLSSKLYTLQFNIYPVQLGENNTVHAFVYTPAGAPLPADQWTISSRLLGRDLEPVSEPLLPLIPKNHAAGAVTFPFPGTYQLRFTVRTTDIDEATVTTTIQVPQVPASR